MPEWHISRLEFDRYGSLKIMSNHPTITSPGLLTIDLNALAKNFCALRTAVPAECAAVIKANAYGLGVEPVAQRLFEEGCRHFFVANAKEGLELRGILSDASIYVFEGVSPGGEEAFLAANLVPVLNSIEQVRCWRVAAPGFATVVHIDTGMSRLGLSALEVEQIANEHLLDDLNLKYVLTHLACADEPSHALNAMQLKRFDNLRNKLPAAKTSIGNSAGSLIDGDYCGDLARPGIALFGGSPFFLNESSMKTVVSLHGIIIQVREITETVTVGYGASHTIVAPARLAIVGVGYADGYSRALSNRGVAFLAGKKVPVVGRVSMDLITLDVSEIPLDCVKPGKLVELLGKNIPLDERASLAGTVSYEMLTGIGRRWSRNYVGT
jgi:alanine racemase